MFPPGVVVAFLDYAALVCTFGALTFFFWVQPRNGDAGCAAWNHEAVRHIVLGSIAALSVTTILVLLVRVADVSGLKVLEAWSHVPDVLAGTQYGKGWLLRCAGLAAIWYAATTDSRKHTASAASLAFAGSCAVALGIAASGHGAAQGWSSAALWLGFVHIFAGGLWTGTVISGAAVLRPPPLGAAVDATMCHMSVARRLSRLATVCFVFTVVSGVGNIWLRVPPSSELFDTCWGLALAFKIAAVALMVAVAGFNRYISLAEMELVFTPGELAARDVAEPNPAGRSLWHKTATHFHRWLVVESVFVVIVLIALASLTRQEPPMDSEGGAGLIPRHGEGVKSCEDAPRDRFNLSSVREDF